MMDISRRKVSGVRDSAKGDDRKRNKDEIVESHDAIIHQDTFRMRREIGLPTSVAIMVGSVIAPPTLLLCWYRSIPELSDYQFPENYTGSGIFVSPRGVLRGTQSVAASLCVWAACGLISIIGALCFAELGTSITKSGGQFAFLCEGLSPHVAFGSAWTDTVAQTPAGMAVVCLTFATYLATLFYDECGPPMIMVRLLAVATIVFIAILNCYSIKSVARIQIIFTVAKVLALVVIIIGGIVRLAQGHTALIGTGFDGTLDSPSSIALSFYSGMFAYGGWQNLLIVTEEVKNPIRNIPLSIMISLPLVITVYMLTNVSYMTVLTKQEILTLPAVAAAWGDDVLKGASFIIPLAVAISTFGASNGGLFAASRIAFVSAREDQLPAILSHVHVQRYTPVPSIILTEMQEMHFHGHLHFKGVPEWTCATFLCQIHALIQTLLTIIMISIGEVLALISFVEFTGWIYLTLTMAAQIMLRFRRKDLKRPIKVPLVLPIFMMLVAIFLTIAPIVQEPSWTFLYAILFILGGYIFYIPFVFIKTRISCLDKVVMWLQIFLNVAPTDYNPKEWEQFE